MTTGQLHRKMLTELQQIYTASEASILTDWIFEKRINFSKADIIKNTSAPLNENQIKKINIDLNRLLQHEPIQYVLQEAWFYKLKLKVNGHVLVPRPETEELVELICNKPIHNKPINIIDIGTGSGCIAIALKKHLPDAHVTAIDIDNNALIIARENALAHKVLVDFKAIDFLNNAEWVKQNQFDVIVSNPPYIPMQEKENLDKNVAGYEPGTALFVPDDNPLLFYKKIIEFAKSHLKKDGKIYVEIHENFASEVCTLFSNFYKKVSILKDLYGKNRFVTATSKIL